MNPSRLTRRLMAGAAGLLVGAVGALALASPASAHHTSVEGACTWDAETSEWVVTWTIHSDAPADVKSYRLTKVDATPEGSTVEGIAVSAAGMFPHDAHQPLVGTQRLPEGTSYASLTVAAEWDNMVTDNEDRSAMVEIPADCSVPEVPEPPMEEQLGEFTFDCETLTITFTNPTEEELTVTFVPSTGDSVEVTVAAGGTGEAEFTASEGLSIEVQVNGQTVPLDEPIEITSEEWAELNCDEDSGGEGGGDEGDDEGLPVTGSSTTLIAGGALALLALGGGLYLVARRRRVTFTA